MRRSRPLALAAMLAALGVVCLYLTAVLPNGGLGFAAVAAVCTAIVYLECGWQWSVAHYAVTGLLGLLLVPEKTYVLWFLLALGHYSILKLCIERLPNRVLQWVLKLLTFACSMALLLWLLTTAFIPQLPLQSVALWAVLTGVFVLYDIGVSGVLTYYSRRLRRRR